MEEAEVSPLVMKKKANVHLEPMSHKKAHLLQTGLGAVKGSLPSGTLDGGMNHSESNPLLAAPVINDRVRLEKLNHIPSVKSNLMSSDNLSQGQPGGPGGDARAGLNYEAMPVGKKSTLAPISVMNTQILDSQNAVLQKMENESAMMNRKNNRTLKPIKR